MSAAPPAAAPPAPRRPDQRADQELVAAVREGDDDAFGVLFERYRRPVTGLAGTMVGDRARAEDITQEVFLSALRRMRATSSPIAFKPWIYEIARNACIDSHRRSRHGEELSIDVDQGFPEHVVARLATSAPGPVTVVEDRQRLVDLRGAFGGLSEAEKGALVMRELEGRSYREIGERLEMGRPAVESTLFRARRKLEAEYEELSSGERCRRVQAVVAAASGAGRAPGARDSRRLARHVSHCQPCRRAALAAGLAPDAPRTVRSRVAGLLPVPAFLRPEGGVVAHLLGLAEPAAAWTKALAAAATITAAGVGTGTAVERATGVPLDATGGGQGLAEGLGYPGGDRTGEASSAAAAAGSARGQGGGGAPGADQGARSQGGQRGGAPRTPGARSGDRSQRAGAPRRGSQGPTPGSGRGAGPGREPAKGRLPAAVTTRPGGLAVGPGKVGSGAPAPRRPALGDGPQASVPAPPGAVRAPDDAAPVRQPSAPDRVPSVPDRVPSVPEQAPSVPDRAPSVPDDATPDRTPGGELRLREAQPASHENPSTLDGVTAR